MFVFDAWEERPGDTRRVDPFALSEVEGPSFLLAVEEWQGFDRLSPNGSETLIVETVR